MDTVSVLVWMIPDTNAKSVPNAFSVTSIFFFAQFPKELERIAKLLRTLDLSNNRLHELPALISQFSMLKSLNCDDNRIGEYIAD